MGTMHAGSIETLVKRLQTPPIDERIIYVLTQASDDRRKPIATISIGGTYTELYRKILESKGVPSYNSPNGAIRALERWFTYSEYWRHLKKG